MEKTRLTITTQATENIKKANVLDKVVESLVEKEVARRAETIEKSIDKIVALEKELVKMKPDQVSFVDGTKHESYSKAEWEKKEKAEAEIKKLEDAIEVALVDADYKKLYEIMK